MQITDFNDKTSEIMNSLDNQGKVSNLLADLTAGFSEALQQVADIQAENERLKNDNQELRDNNQKLFLRVTVPETPTSKKDEPEDYTFDKLFEHGHLNLEG